MTNVVASNDRTADHGRLFVPSIVMCCVRAAVELAVAPERARRRLSISSEAVVRAR